MLHARPAADAARAPRSALPVAGRTFDELIVRVVGRPQGVYWLDDDGRREIGPFASLHVALDDMARAAAPASLDRAR